MHEGWALVANIAVLALGPEIDVREERV